jgi:hypothetical protein
MTCSVCGDVLPEGRYASCAVEGRCLTDCSDFAGHCAEPDELRFDAADDELDRAYDSAVDDAMGQAIEAGDPENWRAYL